MSQNSTNPAQPALIELPALMRGRSYLRDGTGFGILERTVENLAKTHSVVMAKFIDGREIPFHGHRRMERIVLETENIVLRDEVLGTGSAEVHLDDALAYTFRFGNMVDALAQAQRVLQWLRDWPVVTDWNDFARHLTNRPVYYREQPAIVERYLPERGQAILIPEDGEEHFEPEPWNRGIGPEPEIYADLLDPRIHWCR